MTAARKLAFLWRWSPIVSLPVAVVYLGWASATWQTFSSFGLEYDARPVDVRLYDCGVDEWNNLARRTGQAISGRTLADIPEQHALNTVQLFVPGEELNRLNSNLPYSGYDFGRGQLMFRDGLHDVRVRYRGDFLPHWGFDKKSIRIKTGTGELFEGMRTFNLIVPKFPEQVNNYLGYRLARTMGVMSPRCELVDVSINGCNNGLYEFTEQLEEGTLRNWNKMPGDLYSGDLISKTAAQGSTNRVFELPMEWEKVAANNHYDLDSRVPLQHLLALINGDINETTEAELSRLLDMKAWGAFGAFELLTQTHHYDEFHNWRLFWDPWALKFQPVVWDPIAWAPDMRPGPGGRIQLDIAITRLHVWLLRNGDFLAARHDALRDFFESGKVEEFTKEVDWALAAAKAASDLDPNTRPTDPDRVVDGMASFRRFYDDVLRDVRVAHLEDPGSLRYTRPDADGVMALQVGGRTPVDELVLRFRQPLAATMRAELRTRRGDERPTVDVSGGLMVQGNTLRVPLRIFAQLEPYYAYLPNQVLRQRGLECAETYYELALQGLPVGNELMAVTAHRSGRSSTAQLVEAIAPKDCWWLYRPTRPQPVRQPVAWSGELTIDGVRRIDDDVIIEPGTLIRMRPAASLLFHGRVTAAGTEDAPIRIVPERDGQEPWGTFAINGPACSGSLFRNLRVRGGSGYKEPMEEYCAMFSIHNCTDVQVEDSRFADNFVVDDMVHVIYSTVQFERCELIKARADALDCDISTVTARNCRFVESDNDGMDLMTTKALVYDCQFVGNRDKGISIGEGTQLIALRDTFNGCVKAMEAKDGSVARAVNCEIRNCQRALNAYRKNWRYDAGGDLTVSKSLFAGNKEMPTADAHSRILLFDCRIDKELSPTYRDNGKITPNHAATEKCNGAPAAQSNKPMQFPAELQALEPFAGQVWKTVRVDARGGGRDD